MSAKAPQFGRVPFAPVAAGLVGKMTPAALRVLLVVCGHLNRKSLSCYLPLDRLTALTGLSDQGVRNGREQLRGLGCLTWEAGRGRGNATMYTLSFDAAKGQALEL